MGWTALTYPSSSILTSAKMTQLFNDVAFVAPNFKNLSVSTITSLFNNNASELNVSADYIAVTNASSEKLIIHPTSFVMDITTTGVSGVDSGSEADDTTYAVWAIYNSGADTHAGIFSHSFTDPILPDSYDHSKLISFARNKGDDIISFNQVDNRYHYSVPRKSFENTIFHTGSMEHAIFERLDVSSYTGHPLICKEIYATARVTHKVDGIGDQMTIGVKPTIPVSGGLTGGNEIFLARSSVASNTATYTTPFGVYINSSQNFEVYISGTGSGTLQMWVTDCILTI